MVTATTLQREAPEHNAELSGLAQLAEQLQQSLWQGLRGLLTINPESRLQQAAKLLQQARQILLAGSAHSAVVAADMQSRLLELGKLALFHSDPAVSLQLARTLPEGSIVLLISDSGENADLLRLEKYAKRRQLQIISLTRFQTSAQSAVADVTLFTLDTETDEHLARLVTQQAQQHLCHLLYLLLCQSPSYRQHITEHNKLLALLEKS